MTWNLLPSDEFLRYVKQWDAINATAGDVPFLGSAFIAPLLKEFGTGRELLAIHQTNSVPDAMALIVQNGHGAWQTFQPSQLPLGAWLAGGGTSTVEMLPALLRRLPRFALNFGVTQVDPRFVARPPDTPVLRSLDYIRTAWIELDGTFDAYWESRGKNLRQNMAKQRRKIESDGKPPVLEVLTEPAVIADALRDYGALESTGWKSEGGTAIHPANAQGRFYRTMLEGFCALGRGRVYRYRFGEKVVAMDLCIQNMDTLIVLKTTYDESYRTVSPAFLMRQDELKALWAEGLIKRVEFYGKLMDWHTRWTDKVRMLYHLNCYRWGFLPSLHNLRAARMREPDSTSSGHHEPVSAAPDSKGA